MALSSSVFLSIKRQVLFFLSGARSVFFSAIRVLPYFLSRNPDELHKEVTEQYPDPVSSKTADDLPARSRGLIYNDVQKCTGCGDCVEICPARCIELKTETGPEVQKKWIAAFDIDFSRCIFCGLCVEACVPQSLVHRREYELSEAKEEKMIRSFGLGHITKQQREQWEKLRKQEQEETL